MGVDMYLYLPIQTDPSRSDYVKPAIDVHGEFLCHELKALKDKEKPTNNNNEDEDDYRGNRRDAPHSKVFSDFHSKQTGWIDVLAWSHGCSSSGKKGNLQDISLTKWMDQYTPLVYVMVMRGEILQHALLRIVYPPKDDKLKVTEYQMNNATISSLSTGGSGGEDRLTENITIMFEAFSMRIVEFDILTGDKISMLKDIGTTLNNLEQEMEINLFPL